MLQFYQKQKMKTLSKEIQLYKPNFSPQKQKPQKKKLFKQNFTNSCKFYGNSYLNQKWQKYGKSIFLPKSIITKQLDTYEWRSKTQFPIVKTKSVNIKYPLENDSELVEVEVVYQTCPKVLRDIFEMTVSQAIYLLKESIIGFQRLYNRFGKFQITQSMILLNQKCQCKVWLNEKLQLNGISECGDINQRKMVQTIIEIIYNHCSLTKNAMKLFQSLKPCNSFLETLKTIEKFIHQARMLVPKRFFCKQSFKQTPEFSTNYLQRFRLSNNLNITTCMSFKSRMSVKSVASKKIQMKYRESQSPIRTESPNPIKRFKSQDQFLLVNFMKASDRETSYSPYSQSFTANPETPNPKSQNPKSRFDRKWLEDSSFLMDTEYIPQKKQEQKQKKQLTQSQAFFEQLNPALKVVERKYSAVTHLGAFSSPRKLNKQKKQINDYMTEFSLIFSNQEQNIKDDNAPITVNQQEEDEQKIRIEHLKKVFESNGWQNNIEAIIASNSMKKSFHEGVQQKLVPKRTQQDQTRLSRLGGMAKRGVAMSILPQQYEEM